jgi:pilus assembly protein CpaB
MSPARIIILVVAVVAGIGAAMLIQQPTQTPAPAARIEAAPTVPVLVAAADIPVGNTVSAADMRWLDWPLASVPAGVVRKDESPEAETELTGQVVRYGILAAEPMRREKLIKTDGTGFLSAVLPAGMRAVAISTDSRGANTAGGFILPNDRVDVIVTVKGPSVEGAGDAFLSDTILRNLRVLAIGQNVQERNGEKVVIGETATLEVEPGQAETLFRAQKMGTLSLSLRSLKDAGQVATGPTAEGAMTIVKFGVTSRSANQ